jgi:hypothetical protein
MTILSKSSYSTIFQLNISLSNKKNKKYDKCVIIILKNNNLKWIKSNNKNHLILKEAKLHQTFPLNMPH